MINLSLNLRNPWQKHEYDAIVNKAFALSENKTLEIELYKCSSIIDFGLNLTMRQSHAGVYLSMGLFGYEFAMNFYDNRHWNVEMGCYES